MQGVILEVSFSFETAVYSAWLLSLALLLLAIRLKPAWWPPLELVAFTSNRKEALLALAAVPLVVGISVATDQLLRPWKRQPVWGDVVYLLQILLVYTPLFALLLWRKQGLRTCFLSVEKLASKVALGVILSLAASALFLLVRGQISEFGLFLSTLGRGGPVAMFQTFMEGFGVGFLLYRLGAWIGIRWAALIAAILFMAAHIPNYTSGTYHLPLPTAVLMAAAHAGVAAFILFGVWKSQDIVVLGFLHWFINAASRFTSGR